MLVCVACPVEQDERRQSTSNAIRSHAIPSKVLLYLLLTWKYDTIAPKDLLGKYTVHVVTITLDTIPGP
jgi:hypothetical protein